MFGAVPSRESIKGAIVPNLAGKARYSAFIGSGADTLVVASPAVFLVPLPVFLGGHDLEASVGPVPVVRVYLRSVVGSDESLPDGPLADPVSLAILFAHVWSFVEALCL